MSSVILISLTACQKEPIASFVMSKSEIVSGETVSFTNTSVDGSSFEWDFGDGSTSSDENPTHTFDKDGVYSITMTATSKKGKKSSSAYETLTVLLTTDMTIYVYLDGTETPVNDCTIRLYTNKTDWDNHTNEIAKSNTNPNGMVAFTKLQPIVYYINAYKPVNGGYFANWELAYMTPTLVANTVNPYKIYVKYYSNKKGTKAYRIVKIERASKPKTVVSK